LTNALVVASGYAFFSASVTAGNFFYFDLVNSSAITTELAID
jgi:hypothetical protein